MSLTELLVEIAGWAGALLTAERVTSRSPLYQAMNVAGAAGFIVNGWWHGAIPSAVLNVIWMIIGGVTLWHITAKRRSSTSAM